MWSYGLLNTLIFTKQPAESGLCCWGPCSCENSA
jgi:hypothetical protein